MNRVLRLVERSLYKIKEQKIKINEGPLTISRSQSKCLNSMQHNHRGNKALHKAYSHQ